MNSTDSRDYLTMLGESFEQADDDTLLGARRTLNSELRFRGYCTDQDSAEGLIVVASGFILGLLCGLSMAAVWMVS